MLTETQRGMLKERREKGDELSNERKKYIDYTLRNYIKKHLDALQEIPDILEVLPKSQTNQVITADRIIGIMKLIEEIAVNLPLIKIDKDGKPYAVYSFMITTDLAEPVKGKEFLATTYEYKFPALPEEVKLAEELGGWYSGVLNILSRGFSKPEYTMDEWNKSGVQELNKIITRRGQEFKLDVGETYLFGVEEVKKAPDWVKDMEEEAMKL